MEKKRGRPPGRTHTASVKIMVKKADKARFFAACSANAEEASSLVRQFMSRYADYTENGDIGPGSLPDFSFVSTFQTIGHSMPSRS
jgi:hypothetical protein